MLLCPWDFPGKKILEWVAISFSRGSFYPRDRTWVSCIVGRRFTIWATREVHTAHLPMLRFLTQCVGLVTHQPAPVHGWIATGLRESSKVRLFIFSDSIHLRWGKNVYTPHQISFYSFFLLLQCHVACGILVPWPGIGPMPPAVEES